MEDIAFIRSFCPRRKELSNAIETSSARGDLPIARLQRSRSRGPSGEMRIHSPAETAPRAVPLQRRCESAHASEAPMLIGYVSDERYVALHDVMLEFISSTGESRGAHSRASGSVHIDLPEGEYRVVL